MQSSWFFHLASLKVWENSWDYQLSSCLGRDFSDTSNSPYFHGLPWKEIVIVLPQKRRATHINEFDCCLGVFALIAARWPKVRDRTWDIKKNQIRINHLPFALNIQERKKYTIVLKCLDMKSHLHSDWFRNCIARYLSSMLEIEILIRLSFCSIHAIAARESEVAWVNIMKVPTDHVGSVNINRQFSSAVVRVKTVD